MNKNTLIALLNNQRNETKKDTRKKIISLVTTIVNNAFTSDDDLQGINLNRSCSGVNLGDVVELCVKKILVNSCTRSNSGVADVVVDGKNYEIKFTTCDAYASPMSEYEKNNNNGVIVVAYSVANGLIAKLVRPNELKVNAQERIVTEQPNGRLMKNLTANLNRLANI